jgi:predicted small lipoprotein YifL
MKARVLSVAGAMALAASLSACGTSTPLLRVASAQVPGSQPHLAVVQTSQDCGDDNGGFGAPLRHFGNPTPFSENPFNACWPK